MREADGDPNARACAIEALESAAPTDIRSSILTHLTPGLQARTDAIEALASALSGSIARLGYPVGMGLGPSADDCEFASARILDRLLAVITEEAAQ